MNDSDLRIMKDTVAVLFAARRGEKPTEKQINDFDNLYHRQKNKPELLIHHPSKERHGWFTDCGLECVGGVMLTDGLSYVTCKECLKILQKD